MKLQLQPRPGRPKTPSIEDCFYAYQRGQLDLRPYYQRLLCWKEYKWHRVIESVLLGMSLGKFYSHQRPDGQVSMIDGQQRSAALFAFIAERFPDDAPFPARPFIFKTGDRRLQPLKNKTFSQWPREAQLYFLRYTLDFEEYPPETPESFIHEQFQRVNMEPTILTAQEIRHAIYHGRFMNLLTELGKDPAFRLCLGRGIKPERMEDAEFVLRFLVVSARGLDHLGSSFSTSMNKLADQYHIGFSTEIELQCQSLFIQAVRPCLEILGAHSFRRFITGADQKDGIWRRSLNRGLFDAILYGFARTPPDPLIERKDTVREELLYLMTEDDGFITSIAKDTSHRKSVKYRCTRWTTSLVEIIHTPTSVLFTLDQKRELYEANQRCIVCGGDIQSLDDASVAPLKTWWKNSRMIPKNAQLSHRGCNKRRLYMEEPQMRDAREIP